MEVNILSMVEFNRYLKKTLSHMESFFILFHTLTPDGWSKLILFYFHRIVMRLFRKLKVTEPSLWKWCVFLSKQQLPFSTFPRSKNRDLRNLQPFVPCFTIYWLYQLFSYFDMKIKMQKKKKKTLNFLSIRNQRSKKSLLLSLLPVFTIFIFFLVLYSYTSWFNIHLWICPFYSFFKINPSSFAKQFSPNLSLVFWKTFIRWYLSGTTEQSQNATDDVWVQMHAQSGQKKLFHLRFIHFFQENLL